jgi:hypothetical protein
MVEYTWQQFPNRGFIKLDVPKEILNPIKAEIEKVSNSRDTTPSYNKNLIGQIENEFVLSETREIIFPLLDELAKEYDEQFAYTDVLRQNMKRPEEQIKGYSLDSYWVNFQKKHEYNPLHFHGGVFSFVIWIKIPYDLEEELNHSNSKNAVTRRNSTFAFQYTDIMGATSDYVINVDKSFEGKMVFFPAKLWHCVCPFYTSDEERISVSGNLFFDV